MAQGVVLIPAGANDDVVDTVESVHAYQPASPIIVIDDGQPAAALKALRGHAVVLPMLPYVRNAYGGLLLKICYGLRYALHNYDFDHVLRLDADALMIGSGLDTVMAERFRDDPRLGLIGGFRLGPDGGARDFAPMARQMATEAGGIRSWRKPLVRRTLRALIAQADRDYRLGDHAIACVLGIRREAIEDWARRDLLDLRSLRRSLIGDDGMLGLLAAASGYRIGDLGGPGDPVNVSWKGLPSSPEHLVHSGALAVHSVRSWQDWDEARIRGYFASQRRRPTPERPAS